jgi:hypothetical protein
MYVNAASPRARLIQSFARLGSLAVRGYRAAQVSRARQQSQDEALAGMANESIPGVTDDGEAPCDCEEQKQQLLQQAGRGGY